MFVTLASRRFPLQGVNNPWPETFHNLIFGNLLDVGLRFFYAISIVVSTPICLNHESKPISGRKPCPLHCSHLIVLRFAPLDCGLWKLKHFVSLSLSFSCTLLQYPLVHLYFQLIRAAFKGHPLVAYNHQDWFVWAVVLLWWDHRLYK